MSTAILAVSGPVVRWCPPPGSTRPTPKDASRAATREESVFAHKPSPEQSTARRPGDCPLTPSSMLSSLWWRFFRIFRNSPLPIGGHAEAERGPPADHIRGSNGCFRTFIRGAARQPLCSAWCGVRLASHKRVMLNMRSNGPSPPGMGDRKAVAGYVCFRTLSQL